MSAKLAEVRLLRFPVAVQGAATERHEELLREFSYLTHPHPDVTSPPPARLLAVVDELRSRYGAFTEGPAEQIATAHRDGTSTIDLTYHVPPEVREASRSLNDLLEEVDDYCRSGDLLTLAPSPLMVEFRRWYLGEFEAQVAGAPPTPWAGPVEPDAAG